MVDQFNSAGSNTGRTKIRLRNSGIPKAIAIDPHDEFLFYNLARSRFERGDPESASEALKAGVAINRDFGAGKDFLAYIEKSKRK